MATIEPRLIHLLNESTTPQLLHVDLPPLHSLPLPKSLDLPLPPLEPDTSHRGDRADRRGTDGLALANPTGPLYLAADDSSLDPRKSVARVDGKHACTAAAFPLRLLLGETEATEPSHSFNKILDDNLDSLDDASNKKRHRGLHVKDDFVQLPQPLKKQKAAQAAPVMPPIINGLHEPPPHAALFPPISSGSFNAKDGKQIKLLHEINQTSPEADKTNSSSNKARKRATKPRRKWSEEETNHLLLGVNRHGVGKWTSILEDSDFKFNDRTAGDLKDRFRTCCPDELRRNKASLGSPSSKSRQPKQKTKSDTHFDKILIDGDTTLTPEPSTGNEAETNPRQKKSRAHRKKMEDLVELGIHGPFKKSHRRERRPFTEQDDREILEGLNQHGPAWTKIQRDPRFHLTSRQPTDLRDRVRNKYPSIYQRIEKGTFQVNDGGRGNDIMEPSINMSINNSLQPSNTALELQINTAGQREDLPRWPLQRVDTVESTHSSQGFEFGESVTPQFMGGEMDISRLLLDDAQISQGVSRMGVDSLMGPSSGTTVPESRREGLGKSTERAQHAF
ncbi:hypothetical protein B0J13DRAFT_543607 [Dactylonectria estremocensis]|uniref:Myb-like domain-containing protein n=1 Tax=Dactylonectria estremocensis TaxID=1079267 RepID=A0A9P9FBB8_9HYPO|nr:hypothetical protein B0J13DRAFT_543607 [Dactylonectria estremocensis]